MQVIESDIDVHKEQMLENGIYFEATNETDSANTLSNYTKSMNGDIFECYKRVIKIANNFNCISVFSHMVNTSP